MSVVRQLTCAKCQGPLETEGFNTGAMARCAACETQAQVEIFPAFFNPHLTASGSETLLIDAEAGCFYHAQKKATVVCDNCGRFLCGLCDVHLDGRHLCPGCVDSGRKKKKIKTLENERLLYDSLALLLSLAPLLMWPFTLFTAPATVYVVVRHWNSPSSVITRSKVRFVIALVIALVQIAAWIALFYYLVFNRR